MDSLQEKVKIIPRQLIEDDRGWFLKVITGKEENIPNYTGEIYLTMGLPGETKGGHYHVEALEWFTLIAGKATLRVEDINTHEHMEIPMSLNDPKTVFVPNYIAHDFINAGNANFIVLAYTNKLYNSSDTKSYQLKNKPKQYL